MKRGRDEVFNAAIPYIPKRTWNMLEFELFVGDPNFSGLHFYKDTEGGYSYRECLHVVYSYHQMHLSAARRATTLVVPPGRHGFDIADMAHELGHVLHARLKFDYQEFRSPTTYGRCNAYESFAENFAAWLFPRYYFDDVEAYLDPRAVALFESLS